VKNRISAIKKNLLNVLYYQIDMAEERICELEDKSFEITQSEEKKEKSKRKSEKSQRTNGKPLKDQYMHFGRCRK